MERPQLEALTIALLLVVELAASWKWKAGQKKRILFLADRNVLIDQTMVNDFRPFGAAMAKLSTSSKTIERDDGSTVDLTTAIDK